MSDATLPADGAPALREGTVPHELVDAVVRGPLVDASPDAVLIRVPAVGRYLVDAGGAVVERAPGATDADLRCFGDGPVAAAAALLRGDLVLRGAAVVIEGRAVVVCGPSAAGKSALSAALALRGHGVLADSVAAVACGPGDAPVVRLVAPEPVLWPDSVDELGLGDAPARIVRPALAARAYRLGPGAPVAAPLAAVVDLHAQIDRSAPAIEPVTGSDAVHMLLGARWHARLVGPLGREAIQFRVIACAVAASARMRLVHPRPGTPSAALAEMVERAVA